jgi:hypothetical protein
MDPDITDPGWLDDVLGAGDASGTSTDEGGGMPDWLDGILGTVGDVANTAGNVIGGIYSQQQQAKAAQEQRAYLAQLAQTNSIMGTQSTRQVLYIGAGLVLMLLLLRQTAQNR